jgi:hypothetical protein
MHTDVKSRRKSEVRSLKRKTLRRRPEARVVKGGAFGRVARAGTEPRPYGERGHARRMAWFSLISRRRRDQLKNSITSPGDIQVRLFQIGNHVVNSRLERAVYRLMGLRGGRLLGCVASGGLSKPQGATVRD